MRVAVLAVLAHVRPPSDSSPRDPEEMIMADSRTPEDVSPQTDPDIEAEAPLNRAERRAKGKGAKTPMPQGKRAITGHQNRGGGPRQWSNRRGGG